MRKRCLDSIASDACVSIRSLPQTGEDRRHAHVTFIPSATRSAFLNADP